MAGSNGPADVSGPRLPDQKDQIDKRSVKARLAVALATSAVEAGVRGFFTNAEGMVANIAQATSQRSSE